MAVLVAGLLMAQILNPLFQDAGYDDAAVEAPADDVPEVVISDPHAYLYASYPRYARRLDCVITRESHWQPYAYNPRSGAEGLAQFISSTWYSTPQGKAGASRTDPIASIDGAVFLIEHTPQSFRHWQVVSLGYC